MNVSDLQKFDMAEFLNDETEIAEYLKLVIEENDASELARALGTIARARGMNDIAKASGVTREALYRALRPGAKPRYAAHCMAASDARKSGFLAVEISCNFMRFLPISARRQG
jgi:probable addiction module antidote protein